MAVDSIERRETGLYIAGSRVPIDRIVSEYRNCEDPETIRSHTLTLEQVNGATIQSGTPFSIANGSDRNNDVIHGDRPDIGNPNAPMNTRAIIFPTCATGYQNPDTGSCVRPSDVHWVEGKGFPNAATVGRNTLRTGGTNNFDVNLTKSIPFGETRRLDLRWEAMNAFNHPQYINVPPETREARRVL
jgi:hypothetical protein